ncbi:hypothetical protein DICSQDRAFT_156158 [Dichomitus squalens LYAD-421 SS1]|uniref:Uncharacterized protein n=1 Tax=Dichomitus squalens (strain LYAD-421) TaxID=732165 RepID=R7SUN2_DICSQ|nr:uncharacterized protein DICSQDRAFT_156158 [Dichomitus squalens LYAD-421 SS1]EJF59623.1 hypothetical protein DICSQDRAFT_156158 [Dichomitus squalens LYAD-421 SS1]
MSYYANGSSSFPMLDYSDEDDVEGSEIPPDKCQLCDGKDDLEKVRLCLSHGDYFTADNPLPWLESLKLIPKTFGRNHPGNRMMLCKPHADAYRKDVWRWFPSADVRSRMRHTEATTVWRLANDLQGASPGPDPKAIGNATGIREDGTLVDRLDSSDRPSFDVLIFMPQHMPPIPNVILGGERTGVRVIQRFKQLALNPYVVFAVGLRMLNSVYVPLPDTNLKSIEQECLDIRAGWNEMGLMISYSNEPLPHA